jgi:glycosyltransferase involved in cell wall biosynthesis
MQNLDNKKVAIICDWIKDWWWAEVVLEQFLEIFPNADIFSSVFYQEWNQVFKWKKITTSFIQKIPILNKSHKLALTFRPQAFESFDLSEYDIVISSTSAESKWVITKPHCLHICYCHTPTRYFWSHYHEYLQMMEFWGLLNFIWKYFAPKIIHKLRKWDFVAAQRPDYFIANSKNTSYRITKYYNRESEVIYPSIDIQNFQFNEKKDDYYLYVWRCIPYKKFDLIVDAFNKNGKKLILVTNTENKLYKELKSKSKSNIIWKLNISREETKELFSNTKAFLFPPEEDFWIVPIEAMACGTPVIAYHKWWALETVIEWKTWIFFNKQTSDSLNTAIKKFENINFNYKEIRKYAEKFDKKIFKEKILDFINKKLEVS